MQSAVTRWVNKFIPFCALKGQINFLSWVFSPLICFVVFYPRRCRWAELNWAFSPKTICKKTGKVLCVNSVFEKIVVHLCLIFQNSKQN